MDKKAVEKVNNFCYTLRMDLSFCSLLKDNREKFEEFKDFLLEYNEKCNLTSICAEDEVWIKHFYDSVAPEKFFTSNAKVIEIGSGGGFPSIPLMIVRGDLKFTLIESTGKKCTFLQQAVDKLVLNCEQVLNIRAEDGARDFSLREKFDIVTARAVAKLNTLAEYCLPFVKVGGLFIAYKSENEDLSEAENAVKILGGRMREIYEYSLPQNGGKRRAVIIKKVSATPQKYPRGNGKERKNPL